MAIEALFRGRRVPTTLVPLALVLVFTWLAVNVHTHGWATAFDAPTASWVEDNVNRSRGIEKALLLTALVGNRFAVATAAIFGGVLLSWRASSVRPGVVVIGTVAGAVLTNTAIRAVVYRPVTEAEVRALPSLSAVHHSFPSGHVAGIGALLGIFAASIMVGRSRVARALAAASVVAGMVVVALSRLSLGVHWFSDVVGGGLLAGVFVSIGSAALVSRSNRSVGAGVGVGRPPATIGLGGQRDTSAR